MQNVALAYKQTQAGTTGQDEVLLMLFDGVLRFLAQAREKMEAKDFAAKGILISRSLDIINELDSSLNMELGGELAKNLHQLYFLCTTRLLQANLKLDMAKLDSVVDILSGLRSAFAEVAARPEAKAACAQISSRNAGKHANVTASRPLSSSGGQMPPGGGNQGDGQMPATSARTAAGLYGQQNFGGQPAPISPQPMAQAALLATQMVTQNTFGVPAPQAASMMTQQAGKSAPPSAPPAAPLASAPASRVLAQAYGQAVKPVQVEAPHSAPAAPAKVPVTPAPVAPQVSGFAGKRLAMYGKT